MVICLCKGVSDKKIHQLIAGGAKSLRDIMASCQAGSDCGSCVCAVKEMLRQPQDEADCKGLDRASNE
jgi:bacterioferritin-associated ferredoxin